MDEFYLEEFYLHDEDLPPDDDDDDDSDDDDSSDSDEEGEIKYKWETSNGGCAVCTDMAQVLHDEEPEPPHILCDCTVTEVRKGANKKCKREYSVEIVFYEGIHNTDIPKELRTTFTLRTEYIVHCPDGTDIEGVSEIEIDYDDYKANFDVSDGYLTDLILEDIDNDPDNECEPCDPFPVA